MKGSRARLAVGEIAAMTALILSYEWLWNGAFPGHFPVVLGLYLGIGISSHLRRGETLAGIGFRFYDVVPATRQALLFIGPLIAVVLAIGLALGTLSFPRLDSWWLGLPRRIVWVMLQQYGLLAFYYRRQCEVLSGKWPPILAAASCFALFHLPNPFLTPVSFLAGALSCWLYRRVPNVWALGIAHGLLSTAIARSLPLEWTVGMRVGPGFFRYLERLAAGG